MHPHQPGWFRVGLALRDPSSQREWSLLGGRADKIPLWVGFCS
jgi:hypothetical protein